MCYASDCCNDQNQYPAFPHPSLLAINNPNVMFSVLTPFIPYKDTFLFTVFEGTYFSS